MIDEVVATQRQQVSPVRPVRGRRQPQQKARGEVVEQPAIAGGAGVVELVHHDVVEGIRGEAAQVTDPAEGLDRGEEDVGAFILLRAVEPAEARAGPDPAEGGHRLGQDLLPMGHEQHPGKGTAVEGGEPCLAEARRQNDQPGPVPGGPRIGERRQGRALDRVRLWRREDMGKSW